VPVVVGVVEPAVVEVAAEVAGACSVAVGVVGGASAVGVDGVVGVTAFEPAALSCIEEPTGVEPALLLVVDADAVLV